MVIGAVVALLALSACEQIGGASNTFGNDPTRAGTQPQLWASIGGPYSLRADGDPWATKCAVRPLSATSCDGSGANSSYIADGYTYAVTVAPAAVGLPVTVAVYDPADAAGSPAHDSLANGGFATSYQLFNTTGAAGVVDQNASNGMNTLGRCSIGPGYRVFSAGSTESAGAWYTLCTFTPTSAGVYPLQVKSSAIPSVPDSGGGFNNFSIRATSSSAAQPTVSGWQNASVFVDLTSGTSRSYLVNVPMTRAGQMMIVDLFDPGDSAAGDGFLQVLAPPSGSPNVVPTGGTPVACSYSDPGINLGPPTTHSAATCTVQTRIANASIPNAYNGKWLRLSIPVPANYTCSTDCWWTLATTYASTSSDRIVYSAYFPTS